MGIENGANEIISLFEKGLYAKRPTRYEISIDGELVLYKGMTQENLSRRNAEEHIAVDSYNYLVNMCLKIERMILQQQQQQQPRRITPQHRIVVYMDSVSERVMNKKIRSHQLASLDSHLMRNLFITMCERNGHIFVEQLGKGGESELQMYLLRDQTCPLNIFVTNDSDFISIAYNHQPKTAKPLMLRDILPIEATDASGEILDSNNSYEDCSKIVDSCLWIKCCGSKSAMRAYGLDYNVRLVDFSTSTFRLLVALCGTDFTTNILTTSMIRNIVSYIRRTTSDVATNRLLYAFCAKNPESAYKNEALLDSFLLAASPIPNNTMRLFSSFEQHNSSRDLECVMLCLFALALGNETASTATNTGRVTLKRQQGGTTNESSLEMSCEMEKRAYASSLESVRRQYTHYESYLRTGIMVYDPVSNIIPNAALLNKIWLHTLWLQYYTIERRFSLKLLRNNLTKDIDNLTGSVARKFLIDGCDKVFEKIYQSKLVIESSVKLSQNMRSKKIKLG